MTICALGLTNVLPYAHSAIYLTFPVKRTRDRGQFETENHSEGDPKHGEHDPECGRKVGQVW